MSLVLETAAVYQSLVRVWLLVLTHSHSFGQERLEEALRVGDTPLHEVSCIFLYYLQHFPTEMYKFLFQNCSCYSNRMLVTCSCSHYMYIVLCYCATCHLQTSWASPHWAPEASTPPHSPPTQPSHPSQAPLASQDADYGTEQDPKHCSFYLKTGACRFKERCSKLHPRPRSSTTLMLPGMFTSLGFMEQLVEDRDQDTELEVRRDWLWAASCLVGLLKENTRFLRGTAVDSRMYECNRAWECVRWLYS